MSYWLHQEAEEDLGEAAVYYARHANRSIAEAFLDEFERVVALIESNQQLGTPKEEGMRVYPFRRFPYSLVYREDRSGLHVYAIANHNREPGYWLGRHGDD